MSSDTDAPIGSPTDVGSRLRAAREAKQISLREIAATTKVSVSALEALDENDVTQLPGGIFSAHSSGPYAEEVGLDPEQTIRDFMAHCPRKGSRGDPARQPVARARCFSEPAADGRNGAWLVVVGVPVAAILLFLGTRNAPTETEAPEAPVVDVAPAAPARVEPPASVAPPVVEPMAQGSLTIVVRPREDCWVSLRVDGELVLDRVMRAGDRESYEADDEVILSVADAGAFAFAINQQDGRSLGASGEVGTARITPQNYRSYVAP